MENPEKTVRIRYATEVDMFLIGALMKKYDKDISDLNYRDCIIATENGEAIGIGRVKKNERRG